MQSQVMLAIIFFLILLTFKSPPPQFLTSSADYISSKDLSASLPFLPFRENNPKKEFSVESLEAKSVYVYDARDKKIIYEKNSGETLPLASLTKLMTALVIEENSDPSANFKISEFAYLQAGDEGLRPGDSYRKDDLIDIILAASSNDAAWAAAESLNGGQGIENFISRMNSRAHELGFSSLNFYNPHGLDIIHQDGSKIPGATGNARDMSGLLKYIYENHPKILEKTRMEHFSVNSDNGRIIALKNTNEAIKSIPQIIGGKTGYTRLAGGNLIFIFDADFNRPIIVAILGSSEAGRFDDARKISDAVLKYYQE